jgi:hypothetical protein
MAGILVTLHTNLFSQTLKDCIVARSGSIASGLKIAVRRLMNRAKWLIGFTYASDAGRSTPTIKLIGAPTFCA